MRLRPKSAAAALTETKMRIVYDSPRRICPFDKGVVSGIGRRYRRTLNVREPACMQSGSPHRELIVESSDAPSEHASGRIA